MGRKSLYKTEEERKEARRKSKQKFLENNKDKQKEYSKKFYSNHKEEFKEYYENNKDKILDYHNKYYENNKETILKKQRKKYINDYSLTIKKKENHNERKQLLGQETIRLYNNINKIINRDMPNKYTKFKDEYNRLKTILKDEFEKDRDSEETKNAYDNFIKFRETAKNPPITEEEQQNQLRNLMNYLVDRWNGAIKHYTNKQLDAFSSARIERVEDYIKNNPSYSKNLVKGAYTKAFALYYESQIDVCVKSKDDEDKINKIKQKRVDDVIKLIDILLNKNFIPFNHFYGDFVDKDGCFLYEENLRKF